MQRSASRLDCIGLTFPRESRHHNHHQSIHKLDNKWLRMYSTVKSHTWGNEVTRRCLCSDLRESGCATHFIQFTFLHIASSKYRGGNKRLCILLCRSQTGPGRPIKQERGRNLAQARTNTFSALCSFGKALELELKALTWSKLACAGNPLGWSDCSEATRL